MKTNTSNSLIIKLKPSKAKIIKHKKQSNNNQAINRNNNHKIITHRINPIWNNEE
ncbi:MAG: hypothetical protein GWP09_02130 [Nitrospiraceae bacterium]|nr:hypothetical protein [Nitrospiraceae bacterium]